MKFGSGSKKELNPPSGARQSSAKELARIWQVEEELIEFSFTLGSHSDPAAWGIILADFIREVVQAYKQSNKAIPEDYILDRIRSAINAEFDPADQG